MHTKQINTIKRHLTVREGKVITTSLDVANFFGRKHKHVLDAIERLEVPEEFNGPNFRPVEYKDPKGEMRPMYEMTRKGFVLLAMGFTGKRAMRFKIAYIEAFDAMEKELARRHTADADALLFLQASAARSGRRADFLPRLVHLTRAGLSCREIGLVLGLAETSIARWQRRMRAAGVYLPRLDRSMPAHMQERPGAAGAQLSLPFSEAAR